MYGSWITGSILKTSFAGNPKFWGVCFQNSGEFVFMATAGLVLRASGLYGGRAVTFKQFQIGTNGTQTQPRSPDSTPERTLTPRP